MRPLVTFTIGKREFDAVLSFYWSSQYLLYGYGQSTPSLFMTIRDFHEKQKRRGLRLLVRFCPGFILSDGVPDTVSG